MPRRVSRGKAKHATKKSPSRVYVQLKASRAFRNHEELVVHRLTQAPKRKIERGLQIQDLIYNSATELRLLGFGAGFNLGSEAYKNSKGSISALEHLLENAGFGNVVYYPFESRSTFTSRSVKPDGIKLGMNVHVFEAGVISGYLTAHAKQHIPAREIECVFNGFPHCKFIAGANIPAGENEYKPLESTPNLVEAIQQAMLRSRKPTGENHYYFAAIKPLLAEPVFSELEKFMYFAGKLLPRERFPDIDVSVSMAANFLKIDEAKVVTKKGKTTLSLVYKREAALGRFVDLTIALISGLVQGTYGRDAQILSRSLAGRGVYNVKMEMLAATTSERT